MAVSFVLDGFSSLRTSLTPAMILVSFIISAAVGVFFGYYPARRAVQMNPIEPLRYE